MPVFFRVELHKKVFIINHLQAKKLSMNQSTLVNKFFKYSYYILFLGIVSLNPILYLFDCGFHPSFFHTDLSAYIQLSKEIIDHGRLTVLSWGHVDSGLILPPMYPLLIAIGTFFSQEVFFMAHVVTWLSALLVIIPISFVFKEIKLPFAALAALLCIFFNNKYFYYSIQPVTEATFMLFAVITLYIGLKLHGSDKAKPSLALLTGMLAGMTFLCRHLGISLIIFLLFWQIIQLALHPTEKKIFIAKGACLLTGFIAIFLPYSIILFHQTGQIYITQHYRQDKYAVYESDDKVLGHKSSILNATGSNYKDIYKSRRELRQLTPDSSEMLEYLIAYNKCCDNQKSIALIAKTAFFIKNFYFNILHIYNQFGPVYFILFLLSCFSPIFIKLAFLSRATRAYFLCFIVIYILLLSHYTSFIARYVEVIFPIIIIHLCIEFSIITMWIKRIFKFTINNELKWKYLFFVICVIVISLGGNRYTYQTKWFIIQDDNVFSFRKYIQKGDPVFVLKPYRAIIVDGIFRVVPNASIQKIYIYAKKTGVKWLIVDHAANELDRREIQFYNNAPWLTDKSNLEIKYPEIIKLKTVTDEGVALYQFKEK